MDDAKEAILRKSVSHGDVFTAKLQTKGRGRRGRHWETFSGNLYYTIVLKDIPLPARLGFFISLALAELLGASLKWPNDVLLNKKKVAGILIEACGDFMVVGVGVNVVSHPDSTPYPATSLRAEGICIAREELISNLTDGILKNLTLPFSDVLSAWQKRALFLNEAITVNLPDRKVSGIFRGLDPDGFLLLETHEGLQKFMVGDVFC